jgi:glycosyltransferase involved in cell wall biosynthesis
LVDCYFPTLKSAAKHVRDLGCEFRARGHEVIVVTPGESISGGFELSIEDDLTIARVKAGKLKGAWRPLRAFREARLSARIWKRGKHFFEKNPCDLIVFYSPTIFWGSLVRKLKELWGCPAYLVLRDIWPQFLVDIHVLRKGWGYQFFRKKELEQNESADVIGVQSPGDLRYFADEFPAARYRLEVLFNWATPNELNVPSSNYRERLGLQDKVVFFYGGNFGVAQDLDNILRLAKNLENEPHVFFLLVGWGSEVDHLKTAIRERGMKNIRLLPAVPQAEYLAMVAEFDVGLISLDRRFRIQNIPGKLMAYLYHAKPVLASVNPGNDLAQILEESSAGYCCQNGDDQTLARHASLLASNENLRRRLGQNGRRLLEQTFAVAKAADQILRTVPAKQSGVPQEVPQSVENGLLVRTD